VETLQLAGTAWRCTVCLSRTRIREPAVVEGPIEDALLGVSQARGEFRGAAAVRTWLVGILANKVVDHLRRAAREIRYDDDAPEPDPPEAYMDNTGYWRIAPLEFRDPRAIRENAQLRAALDACIDGLSPKLRETFVPRGLDGQDTSALIETLGLSSTNNLRVPLSRARERVPQCADTAGVTHGELPRSHPAC
jgi:RNA polymerase sigma-70 factor (ECF subfamily)